MSTHTQHGLTLAPACGKECTCVQPALGVPDVVEDQVPICTPTHHQLRLPRHRHDAIHTKLVSWGTGCCESTVVLAVQEATHQLLATKAHVTFAFIHTVSESVFT